jgi:uncharacterized membrane protein (UPF0136 family)
MKWLIYGLVIVIGAIIGYVIKDSYWSYTWGVFIGCIAMAVLDYRKR